MKCGEGVPSLPPAGPGGRAGEAAPALYWTCDAEVPI